MGEWKREDDGVYPQFFKDDKGGSWCVTKEQAPLGITVDYDGHVAGCGHAVAITDEMLAAMGYLPAARVAELEGLLTEASGCAVALGGFVTATGLRDLADLRARITAALERKEPGHGY